jgi:methylated-DNA-protein-cysteine methyltransferase-like protein
MELKEAVWQILSEVPAGQVITYGELARMAGYPTHARQVGAVLKALPKDTTLPWHRVINSRGCISFPEGSRGYKRQVQLLRVDGVEVEGVKVKLNGKGRS